MKKIILLLAITTSFNFLFINISCGQLNYEWARFQTGYISSISTLDNDNNIYVLSTIYESVDLGDTIITSRGWHDVLLAKYDINSNLIWVKHIGGQGQDRSTAVTCDDNNDVYITGSFYKTCIIEDTSITSVPVDVSDVFIIKFGNNGDLKWIKQFGGTYNDTYCNVVISDDQNLYLIGGRTPSTSLGNDTVILGGFVAKYNLQGDFCWGKSIAGSRLEASIINAGNIYVAGEILETCVFGDDTLISRGRSDVFIAKYDSLANLLWVRQFGGEMSDVASSITTDNQNDIYITGAFEEEIIIENDTFSGAGYEGNIFITKYDSIGNYQWAKTICSNGNDGTCSILSDNKNNIYVSGFFSDSAYFDSILLIPTDYGEGFIAKYNSNGVLIWVEQIISGLVTSMEFDKSTNMYISGGVYNNTITLGDTSFYVYRGGGFIAKANEIITGSPYLIKSKTNNVRVFPNPADNRLWIDFAKTEDSKNCLLKIYNSSGQLIHIKQYATLRKQMDISILEYPNGLYFLNIQNNTSTNTIKFIINR